MDLRRLLVGWTLPLVVALLPVYSGRPARTLSLVGARSLPRGHHWAVGHFLGKKSLAAGPMESLYRLINPSTHRELETARPSASHRMRLIVRASGTDNRSQRRRLRRSSSVFFGGLSDVLWSDVWSSSLGSGFFVDLQ